MDTRREQNEWLVIATGYVMDRSREDISRTAAHVYVEQQAGRRANVVHSYHIVMGIGTACPCAPCVVDRSNRSRALQPKKARPLPPPSKSRRKNG